MNNASALAPLSLEQGVEFRLVDGFPGYCVSNNGDVWSQKGRGKGSGKIVAWRRMCLCTNSANYIQLSLYVNGKKYPTPIHRIVAIAFIGPPKSSELEVAHSNGIRSDNRVENQVGDTQRERFRQGASWNTLGRRDMRNE